MSTAAILSLQGRRLLQAGIILLLFTSFGGFIFPHLASPGVGLAAHRLCALLAPLFLGLGLLWPRLALSSIQARAAFILFIYSASVIVLAYLLAAVWRAGAETMVITAAGQHGSDLQETVIRLVAYSSGPAGIVAFALMLWGLRKDGASNIRGT
jgi:hydroxylaminobenzene mutase